MIKFIYDPHDVCRITSPFGYRKHPVTGKYTGHNGIDVGAIKAGVQGDNLYAVADGKVIISKVNSGGVTKGYGYYIVIQHSGFVTLYGHLRALEVKAGQTVKAGEVIAHMGNTGTSTAAHCHFGLIPGAYKGLTGWIDPKPYLGGEPQKEEEMIEKKQMKIDGKDYAVEAIEKDGFNFVKLQSFTQAGYKVSYDGKPIFDMPSGTVQIDFKGKIISVPGVNINGVIKSDLRPLLEAMGYEVGYKEGTVTIK